MNDASRTAHGAWIFGITGASGMRYALRLLEICSTILPELHVVISEAGLRVLREEENKSLSYASLNMQRLCGVDRDNVVFYNPRDIGARIASGSMLFEGMVIVPCTTGTMAAVAHGICDNLVHRAADVTLKERRKLVVVPRETPLSTIHLENMLTLSRAGAALVPAMPGFYHQPASIDELVDMMVMKILDQMGIPNSLVKRWKEDLSADIGRAAVVGQPKFATEVA
ncbi:MAG: UbiX family flavin prenyltransferase [Oligoflexia bacterium]|nr:UbiX family flavin prenyltransferase [Oligoflexia bacterium]